MSFRQIRSRCACARSQSNFVRRGRMARRLWLEPLFLEDRTLLTSAGNLTLSGILSAYDSASAGIAALNDVGATAIVNQALGAVTVPFINQSLASLSQLDLPELVEPSLVSIQSLLAGLPGAPTDATASWNQVQTALMNNGFSIPIPWTGQTSGTLLEVAYTSTTTSASPLSLNIDQNTPFSYLNDGFFANFSATVQFTVPYSVTFGVDIPSGQTQPTFFMLANPNAFNVTITSSIAANTIDADLDIGDLASVTAANSSQQTVLNVTGSLGFYSTNTGLDAGNKLRASDFTGNGFASAVKGNLNGSANLSLDFDAQLSDLPDIPWTGTFSDAIQNDVLQPPSVSLTPPSLSSLLDSTLFNAIFNLGDDIPVLGPLASSLDQPLPLIGESIAELTGLDGDLPELPSLPSGFADDLDGSYPLAGGTLSVDITPASLLQFVEGQEVDFLSWETSGNISLANFNFDIPIFSFGVPDIASAEIDAIFGLNASLHYHLGFGLDSNGVYLDAGTPADPTLGLSFGVDAGLQGQVEVFGFPLASIGGDIGFAIEPYVTLTAPPWAADPSKVYLSDLSLFGSNPADDLLDDLGIGIQGDLTGDVFAKIDLFLFSISWSWGVSIPVFNYERDPTWPAEGGGGSGGGSTWSNVSQSGGTLTFTNTSTLNDNITLSEGSNNSVTVNWAGHGAPQTFQGVNKFVLNGSGSSGNDRMTTTQGFDIPIDATAGSGNDYLQGGEANDTLVAGSGKDTLIAGSGSDSLTAGPGQDVLVAGSGNDTLQGGSAPASVDSIYGGSGSDSFVVDNGRESVYGGSGDDTITAGPGSTGTYFIDGGAGSYTPQNPEIINLSADTSPNDAVDSIYGGTGGDNLITGSSGGYNLIYGGGPGDTIFGNGGHDTIYGGAGQSPAQPTDNVIYGGDLGFNVIYGAGAGDMLYGAAFTPSTTYGGNTTIYGGTGTETIFGGDGQTLAPSVTGAWDAAGDNEDPGGNLLVAGRGNDTIFSDAYGKNTLVAGAGSDVLWAGGAGNPGDGDYLTAGTGLDSLYGGPGNDTFQLQFTPTGQQPDLIVGGPGVNSVILKPDAVDSPALISTVNATATTLDVTDALALDGVGASNFVIQVGSEQMLVTQVAGNNLTVVRGYDNTAALAHNAGTAVAVEQPSLVNNPTLADAVTSTTSTTLTVNNAAALDPTATSDFVIQVDNEEMLVENVVGNTLTVERGRNGTTAATHASGAAVTVVQSTLLVPYPTLVAPITATTATSVTVSDALALSPTGAGGFIVQIDTEQMFVTAVNLTTNTLTVVRGYDGTAPATHVSGAPVIGSSPPALDPSATTLTVTNVALLGGTSLSGAVIQIGNEQMLVTGVNLSTDTLTVVRGYSEQTGTTTAGSNTISGLATPGNLAVGQPVSGSGISSGSTIASINTMSDSITISHVATTSNTISLAFSDGPSAVAHFAGAVVSEQPILPNAVTATATTLTVSDAAGLAPAGNYDPVILVDSEQMLVTAASGNTLTVERGFNNTTAAPHASGASVLAVIVETPTLVVPGPVLAAAVTSATSTTITVSDATALAPTGVPNFVIQVDAEQIFVTGIVGDTLTVERGFNGTTAATHALDAPVFISVPLALDPTATAITVANAAILGSSLTGSIIQVDDEQMLVTAVSGNVLTVERGFNNTTVAVHDSGAAVSVEPTLAAAVTSTTATTLTVSNSADFLPSNGYDPVIQIDDEWMLVTGVTGDVLTVTRGFDNTIPASHASGGARHLGRRAGA